MEEERAMISGYGTGAQAAGKSDVGRIAARSDTCRLPFSGRHVSGRRKGCFSCRYRTGSVGFWVSGQWIGPCME